MTQPFTEEELGRLKKYYTSLELWKLMMCGNNLSPVLSSDKFGCECEECLYNVKIIHF